MAPYKDLFFFISPGKNPMSLLLSGTIGLAKYICLKSSLVSKAPAKANKVLPVPATPCNVTNLILGETIE